MLTNTWQNDRPSDQDVIAVCAGQIRTLKQDFRERLDEYIPIGSIWEWPMETAPDGFMECAGGGPLAVSSYYDLFLVLGYRFGGSGANFYLPDARGLFVRCWKHGRIGYDLDADAATSLTGNISGTAISSITLLAGVPRLGARITGTGIPIDTYITAITGFDSNGIPTGLTISQSATTGTGIVCTIDNDINGSTQYDSNKTHNHGVTKKGGELGTSYHLQGIQDSTGSSGGNESRPKSDTVMYIIRTDTV
jgi:hypothetical protein